LSAVPHILNRLTRQHEVSPAEALAYAFAWIFSVAFHPLLMPTYLHALVFRYCTDLLPFTREAKVQTLLFVFVATYLVPSLATGLLWATGTISSLSLEKRSERLIPLFVTAIIYSGVSYVFLDYLSMARLLGLFMGTVTLSVVLTAFITHFWKISAHMVGLGGMVGFLVSVILRTHNQGLEFPLIGFVLISGLVASSRLYLKAHGILQICAGFLLGMVLSWSAVHFFV
jgi:membrane-associated phospholipid phosphatase